MSHCFKFTNNRANYLNLTIVTIISLRQHGDSNQVAHSRTMLCTKKVVAAIGVLSVVDAITIQSVNVVGQQVGVNGRRVQESPLRRAGRQVSSIITLSVERSAAAVERSAAAAVPETENSAMIKSLNAFLSTFNAHAEVGAHVDMKTLALGDMQASGDRSPILSTPV